MQLTVAGIVLFSPLFGIQLPRCKMPAHSPLSALTGIIKVGMVHWVQVLESILAGAILNN